MKVFPMNITNERKLCAHKFWKMAKEFFIKVKQSSEKLTDKAQKEISVHKTISYLVTCTEVSEADQNV